MKNGFAGMGKEGVWLVLFHFLDTRPFWFLRLGVRYYEDDLRMVQVVGEWHLGVLCVW